jgi:hypothetical protein
MYNNIGILTTRGSGTSGKLHSNCFGRHEGTIEALVAHVGYVQTNKFNLRRAPDQRTAEDINSSAPAHKQANRDILQHNERRELEVKLLQLQDELEADG